MREIRFRGKRVGDGEWVYGDYSQPFRSLEAPNINHLCWISSWNEASQCRNVSSVDPETVGQFMNINDEDGAEVFEGDIMRDDKHGTTYREGSVTFTVTFDAPFQCSVSYDVTSAMVTGNIHDNPELAEGKGTDAL